MKKKKWEIPLKDNVRLQLNKGEVEANTTRPYNDGFLR